MSHLTSKTDAKGCEQRPGTAVRHHGSGGEGCAVEKADPDQPVQRAAHELKLAHEALDRAVLAAYAATDPAGEWCEEWADVWTDTGAGQPLPVEHPLHARRVEVDQRVLANLLRLNHERAAAQKVQVAGRPLQSITPHSHS